MVLPANVRPYQRTPEFSEVTVPRALLEARTTKQGGPVRFYVEFHRRDETS
jgi:hypothetical protein